MTLTNDLREHVQACFSGILIQSHEHEDALQEIAGLCREEDWPCAVWDLERGLHLPGTSQSNSQANDPLAAVRSLPSLAHPENPALLVLVNFHRFWNSPEIVQALVHQVSLGKQQRTFVVLLSPKSDLPIELEKQFIVLEHPLPTREQLAELASGIATEEDELPSGTELERVLDASVGLTRYEAEAGFALALVRHGRIEPQTMWGLKTQMLRKGGLLGLHRGQESFADLGGLEPLKAFCLRALRKRPEGNSSLNARGVLLLSPPGCGKSQFAKALGTETGRPVITLDVGSLMGSLVGETERRTRQALQIVDAMSPAILFLDELEKGLAGASNSQTDSGVSSRMFGTLLTWMQERTSDVFLVGTCNNIQRLPPEFVRAGRWDAVYYLDLPNDQQRGAIWDIYLARYGLDPDQARPNDGGFTGAEIQSCCRLAALLDLPLTAAAAHVIPVSRTAAESIEALRQWASGRCLSADRAEIYHYAVTKQGKRRVKRPDPSKN